MKNQESPKPTTSKTPARKKKSPEHKSSRKRLYLFLILGIILVAGIATAITLFVLARFDYVLADNPSYEVNTEASVTTLFSALNSNTLESPDAQLDTSTIGDKYETVTLISKLGTKDTIDVAYTIVDTTIPTITGEDSLSFQTNESVNVLEKYQAGDNSGQKVELSIDGDFDPATAGEYKIRIVAKDESGNEASKEITITVNEPPRPVQTARTSSSTSPYYYIEVNRQQNVVIVYSKDSTGNYSNIAKVFVASTGAPGSETPLGTFTITNRYETLYLVGNVWGHYTVRISGPYFFHSVPYFTKGTPNWDNLEYLEYNKLGSGASAGCVRLSAIDAKWIYDNVAYGTTVKIYDSPTLPAGVTKPSAIKIDVNSPNRGWDPTDPNPANPWR